MIAAGLILSMFLPGLVWDIFITAVFLVLICVILLLNRNKKKPGRSILVSCVCRTYALSTLPDFKQDVHTYILFAPPSVLTRTDFTLDFHIFGVFL